ncbi:hypothetical protein LXL04_035903 [Taraxacum kok-saghyz]
MSSKLGSNHKDIADEVFTTQQTDSMFILTSHLQGYGRRDIKIEINEDGSRITISGENPLEDVKPKIGFKKTFTIPDGVILDKVKARFDQDESRLNIRMPKSVNGIVEIGIQEVKDIKKPNHDTKHEEIVGSRDLKQEKNAKDVQNQECYKSVISNELQPDNKIQPKNDNFDEEKGKENDIEEAKQVEKNSIICTPVIAGSTLFVTLIVVVLGFFRSKNGSREKRN